MWILTIHHPAMQYLRPFGTFDILANERESTNGHESINKHELYDSPLTNE